MGRSQSTLFNALQHRMFCLDPFKRSAASVCIPLIFYPLCMLRCPARVLEDMKTLCRKYFPRELGEIEGLLNVSSANSITDGEELEDEDADIQASLKIVAAEMHVEKDYLMEELRETNGEEHARAEDTHNEETLDLKSNPEAMSMEPIQEAMNMEPIQEVHAKEAQEVKDKSDTAVEKNQTEGTQEPDYDFFWKTTGAV